jgi:hypothetical protein
MAAVLLPAGSASAASSATCGPSSTQIVTGGMHPSNKVWIDGVNPANPLNTSTVVVCVTMNNSLFYSGGLAIVFDAGSGVITPPAVAVTYNPTACGSVTPQWNSASPNLALLVNPATRAVCIRTGDPTTHADVWTSVQFFPPTVPGSLPTLEVWKDGGTNWGFIDAAACPVEYTLYLRGLGGEECMTANSQVFP